jgi:hypothetical protein
MAEEVQYRGFRIMVLVQGTGWRAFIYEPGSRLARREILFTAEPTGRKTVVDDAKRIIDRLLLHSN